LALGVAVDDLLVVALQLTLLLVQAVQLRSKVLQSAKSKQAEGNGSKLNHRQSSELEHQSKHSSTVLVVS